MNSIDTSEALPTPAAAPMTPTRRVIDAPMRMFHWLFALCFIGAYVTADGEYWRPVHVTLGYTLVGLLAFRLVYGLVGPRQARLSLLRRKLIDLPDWLRSITSWHFAREGNWRQGQTLLMATVAAALMAMVMPVTLSGYATYKDWGGEWLEDLHEASGEIFLWLVMGHVMLLFVFSLLRRKNQALPMWTGRIPGAGTDLARREHKWLAALVLTGVLGFWVWQWQQSVSEMPRDDASTVAGSDWHRSHDRQPDA